MQELVTSLMKFLYDSNTTKMISSYVSLIALGMALFMMLIDVAWTNISTALSNLDKAWHSAFTLPPQKVLRYVFILFAINTFTTVGRPLIFGFISMINSATTPSMQQVKDYEAFQKFNSQTYVTLGPGRPLSNKMLQNIVENKTVKQIALDEALANISSAVDGDFGKMTWKKQELIEKLQRKEIDYPRYLEELQENGYSIYSQFNEPSPTKTKREKLEPWQDPNHPDYNSVENKIKRLTTTPPSKTPNIFTQFLLGMGKIIGTVISLVAAVVLNVLLVFLPLSMALSILPIFKDVAVKCLNAILTTGFVFSTIHILYLIHTGFAETLAEYVQNSSVPIALPAIVVVDIVFLVLYTMGFWLTSKWAGSIDTGRVLSKATGIATASIGAAAGGLGKIK